MTNRTKKLLMIVAGCTVLGGLLATPFIYLGLQLNEIQTNVAQMQSDQRIDEFTLELLQDKGNTCLANAYEVYSNEWNRQCFSRGDGVDCLLPLNNRADLTMEYNDDRIDCLIEIN